MKGEPCPFCGKTELDFLSYGVQCFVIVCLHCQAEGPPAEEVELALTKWNCREY